MRVFTVKRVAWTVGAGLFLLVALVSTSLWFSHLETNRHGVHKRLLLPFSATGNIALAGATGLGDNPKIPGFLDGPVVRRTGPQGYSASWFCVDHVETRQGKGQELTIDCAGKTHRFLLGQAAPPAAETAAMPPKVVALSDIEGNLAYLDAVLAKLEIVDSSGNWKFGANSLVIVGDSVDRGRDVFGVLWRLYNLSQQAQAAGGSVHTLLGNHEQYMLIGRIKSVNLDHAHGALQLGGLKAAFGSDTVLGEWLRRQPVLVKLGPVLFTHGGISPELAAHKLTIAQINSAMEGYWRGDTAVRPELDAAIGLRGVTQYRGYVAADGEHASALSAQQLDAVLKPYGASTIVVGHTVVDKVTALFDRRVYAIDVNADSAAPEVLLFEDGVARIVDTGVRRQLADAGEVRKRRLRLTDSADRATLGRVVAQLVESSKVPHPY